jgi:3-deoxy-D-manno-octulosonate 8-phosphate phosphatase KdsC-like HAD superfamily phosphatase
MTAVRAMERDYGVHVAVLSGDDRVNHRFCQMHRLPFYHAVHNKADVLRDIIQDRGCEYQETVFIGDDLLDLEAGLWLQGLAGLFLCPSDAAPDVLKHASVIRARGGAGVLTALYADRDYLFGDVK